MMCVCFLQMSENRHRGGRHAQQEQQAPQEEAAQQQLPPPVPMTIEQMFLMQTQEVQAIGQTLAAMQQVQQQQHLPQPQVQVQMPQVPKDKQTEFMKGHPLSLPILQIPWMPRIGYVLWSVSCTLLSAMMVRKFCMVPVC
jgi:hypothetical protein